MARTGVLLLTMLLLGCGPKAQAVSDSAGAVMRQKHDTSMAVIDIVAYSTCSNAPGVSEPTRYANVCLDGAWHEVGEDGTASFRLAPGRHVVGFRALGFAMGADTVDLKRGEVRTLRHRFVGANQQKEQGKP